MKKIIALLITLAMTLPLASCRLKDSALPPPPSDAPGETTTQPPVENDGSSAEIKYYTIENLESNKLRYTVYNKNGDVVLEGTTERSVEISMLSEALLDVCIDAGTETETHQYYDMENNRLSETYSHVAATSENLVAYIGGSTNDPIADRVLVVRDIFDRNVFYKLFGLDFSPTMRNPIKSATFTAGEAELEVVYFSERPPVPFSITLPIRRSATEGEILLQSEIAMQMYEAALKNEIKVYETDIEKDHYLKDCKTPYGRIPLCELGTMGSVYMDVDGDSINELVIDCGDTLILRYYEGRVYVYPFTFRNLTLNTDGSYSWNYTGQNFEYGENQLAFEGAELKPKELWRIVNDGEPDAEYYIDGKQVTQEEIRKYFEDNPKTRVEFSPLEVSWLNKISRADAILLAKKYWEFYEIEKYGYVVTLSQNSWAPSSVYVLAIKWRVSNHYSTFDEIWIDKFTGEAIIPYAPDGK